MPFVKGCKSWNKKDVKTCRVCGVICDPTPRQLRKGEYLCQEHKAEERRRYDSKERRVRLASGHPAWRNNPDNRTKIIAQRLANKAKREGIISTPDVCERCRRPYHRLEMHHEDYGKPLQVVFLCKSCHGKADYKLRIARGEQ